MTTVATVVPEPEINVQNTLSYEGVDYNLTEEQAKLFERYGPKRAEVAESLPDALQKYLWDLYSFALPFSELNKNYFQSDPVSSIISYVNYGGEDFLGEWPFEDWMSYIHSECVDLYSKVEDRLNHLPDKQKLYVKILLTPLSDVDHILDEITDLDRNQTAMAYALYQVHNEFSLEQNCKLISIFHTNGYHWDYYPINALMTDCAVKLLKERGLPY